MNYPFNNKLAKARPKFTLEEKLWVYGGLGLTGLSIFAFTLIQDDYIIIQKFGIVVPILGMFLAMFGSMKYHTRAGGDLLSKVAVSNLLKSIHAHSEVHLALVRRNKLLKQIAWGLVGLGLLTAWLNMPFICYPTFVIFIIVFFFTEPDDFIQKPQGNLSTLVKTLHAFPDVEMKVNQSYIAWFSEDTAPWMIYWKDINRVDGRDGIITLTNKKRQTITFMPKRLSKQDKKLVKELLEFHRPQYKLHIHKT